MSIGLFINLAIAYNKRMIDKYLLDHFLAWQSRLGERKTLKDFAEYLGISDKLLNHYMTGRRAPGKESVGLIYHALGDERIFEITGFDKPDSRLAFIRRNWDSISDSEKDRVMEMLSKYRTGGTSAANEPSTTPKPHTSN